MKLFVTAALICNVVVGSAIAAPAKKGIIRKPTTSRAAEPAICAKLSSDYEMASKKLAMSYAEGVLDNSAVRASMRENKDNNVLTEARFTMDLMRNNGCKSPTAAPSKSRYLLQAMQCHNDTLEQRLKAMSGEAVSEMPARCFMVNWKPEN